MSTKLILYYKKQGLKYLCYKKKPQLNMKMIKNRLFYQKEVKFALALFRAIALIASSQNGCAIARTAKKYRNIKAR